MPSATLVPRIRRNQSKILGIRVLWPHVLNFFSYSVHETYTYVFWLRAMFGFCTLVCVTQETWGFGRWKTFLFLPRVLYSLWRTTSLF